MVILKQLKYNVPNPFKWFNKLVFEYTSYIFLKQFLGT